MSCTLLMFFLISLLPFWFLYFLWFLCFLWFHSFFFKFNWLLYFKVCVCAYKLDWFLNWLHKRFENSFIRICQLQIGPTMIRIQKNMSISLEWLYLESGLPDLPLFAFIGKVFQTSNDVYNYGCWVDFWSLI